MPTQKTKHRRSTLNKTATVLVRLDVQHTAILDRLRKATGASRVGYLTSKILSLLEGSD